MSTAVDVRYDHRQRDRGPPYRGYDRRRSRSRSPERYERGNGYSKRNYDKNGYIILKYVTEALSPVYSSISSPIQTSWS